MDELISDFLIETKEGLIVLDSSIMALEKNPGDQEVISKIFRVLHTIKGTCGFLGLHRLENISHVGEEIMDKVRSGTLDVTPLLISSILELGDHVKYLVNYLENNGVEKESDDSNFITKLKLASNPVIVEKEVITPIVSNTKSVSLLPADSAQLQALFDSTPYIVDENVTKDANAKEQKNPVNTQTIRLNIDILEELMRYTSELVLVRNQLLQLQRGNEGGIFSPALQRLNNITTGIQEVVMKTRMQPVKNAWVKLSRMVRDLNIELGKKIELKMSGGESELDRQLLELITDPLTHMVRNAADHGIEMPEIRKKSGKPETGTISITAYHSGGYIIIEISDDGAGISHEIIRQKAVEKGLIVAIVAENMNKNQLLQFIFTPGFSTAEKVTSISGRGVGMDVVKNNIEKIGGTVELDSQIGKGSKFNLRIPLTLAIMPVLKLEVRGYKFALPQINVREIVQTGPQSQFHIEALQESHVLRLRGHLLPLVQLAGVLGLETGDIKNTRHFVVICELGSYNFGVIVDQVFDTEEIVVKPISPILKSINMYSANTIIGDGSVILILDPASLAKQCGDIANSGHDLLPEAERYTDLQESSFLMFHAGDETPKVVPLEMLSRLEEIDVHTIEYSHGIPVVQYRGELMRLVSIDPIYSFPKQGIQELLVVSDDNKYMGLVVEKILDIVRTPVKKEILNGEDGFLGSLVIDGKTCDVIDLPYYFHEVFKDDAHKPEINKASMILLVDDSPFFRKFMPPEPAKAGFVVTAVGSAAEGLRKLEDSPEFVAIVTDMNMPDISGQEFVNLCRDKYNFKNIPIIALSAEREGPANFKKGSYKGIDAFITKTNHTELVTALSGLIKDRGKVL